MNVNSSYFHEHRAFGYDILRRIFLEEPTPEFLFFITKNSLLHSFPLLNENELISIGVDQASEDLNNKNIQFRDVGFERYHWDFTRMFIGPETILAPPWESYYIHQGLIHQATTGDVKAFYRKFGCRQQMKSNEAADHIGLELDFLYLQCEQKTSSVPFSCPKATLIKQADFIQEHPLRFIEMFCNKITEHANSEFYKGMANILHGFLREDYRLLRQFQHQQQ